jgi:gas vesicle protein
MRIGSNQPSGLGAVVLAAMLVVAMVGGATAVVGATDAGDSLTEDVDETLDETTDGTETSEDSDGLESTENTTESDADDSTSVDDNDATIDDVTDTTDDADDAVADTTDDAADTTGEAEDTATDAAEDTATDAAEDVETAGDTVTDAADEVTDGDVIDRILTATIDAGDLASRFFGLQGRSGRTTQGLATQQQASASGSGSDSTGAGAAPGAVGITAGATNQSAIASQGAGPATFNVTESEAGEFPESGTATVSLPDGSGVRFDPGNTSAVATADGGAATVIDVGERKVVLDVTSTDPNATTSLYLDGLRFESAPDAGAVDAVWRFGNTSATTAVEPERLRVSGLDEDVPRGAHGTPGAATDVYADALHARTEGFIAQDRVLAVRIPEALEDDVAFDSSADVTARTEDGDCGLPVVSDPIGEDVTVDDHQILVTVSCEIGHEEYIQISGVRFNVSGADATAPAEISAQLEARYDPVDRIDAVDVGAGNPIEAHAPIVSTGSTSVESNATDVTGDRNVSVSLSDDVGTLLGDGSRIAVELEDTGVTFNDSQSFAAETVSGNTSATVVSANATTVELEVDGPSEAGDELRIRGENGSAIRFDVAADANDTAFLVTTTPGAEDVTQRTETVVTVDSCESIPSAIDANDDGQIGDTEVLDANEYWRDDTEVPGTCGETIDDFEILDLIEMWRNDSEVS